MNVENLTPLDVRVYNGIAAYAFFEAVAHPSQQRVADDLGLARETVNRSVRRLVAAGWMQVTKARREGSRWDFNTYDLFEAFTVAADAGKRIIRRAHAIAAKARRGRSGGSGGSDHTKRLWATGSGRCGCSTCRPERGGADDGERFLASWRAGLELRERERLRPSLVTRRAPR